MVYTVPIERRECQQLLSNGQRLLYFLAEAIQLFTYIKCCHQAHNHGKYAEGFDHSIIDFKHGHIPLPLIICTCIVLCHTLLEWQKNTGVHLNASNFKLKVDRPDWSNYFNYQNNNGKTASCSTATGRKLLTPPGVADTYICLINTLNTLPQSYQQRVYNNTLATDKCQIQQAENPMPAIVISVEAACVDNSILLHYLTSKVALKKSVLGSTNPNIPIDNNWTDDDVTFGLPGASRSNTDAGDESDKCDAIPTARQRRWLVTEL